MESTVDLVSFLWGFAAGMMTAAGLYSVDRWVFPWIAHKLAHVRAR